MKCLEPQHMLGLRVMSKKGLDAYDKATLGARIHVLVNSKMFKLE